MMCLYYFDMRRRVVRTPNRVVSTPKIERDLGVKSQK